MAAAVAAVIAGRQRLNRYRPVYLLVHGLFLWLLVIYNNPMLNSVFHLLRACVVVLTLYVGLPVFAVAEDSGAKDNDRNPRTMQSLGVISVVSAGYALRGSTMSLRGTGLVSYRNIVAGVSYGRSASASKIFRGPRFRANELSLLGGAIARFENTALGADLELGWVDRRDTLLLIDERSMLGGLNLRAFFSTGSLFGTMVTVYGRHSFRSIAIGVEVGLSFGRMYF